MTLTHSERKQRKERERSLKARSDSPTLLNRSSRGYHTIAKVARFLGVSQAAVRRELASGKMRSVRIGTYVLVDLDSLEALLEEAHKSMKIFEKELV